MVEENLEKEDVEFKKQCELLESYAAQGKLLEGYSKIQLEYCDDILVMMSDDALSDAVVSDLGKAKALACEELRKMDEKHCVKLLAYYFAEDHDKEHALLSAHLVYGVLQQKDLFEELNQNNRTVQKINSCVHKLVTQEGAPGGIYVSDDLKNDLALIADNISETDPALGNIRSGLKNLISDVSMKPVLEQTK